MAPPQKKRRMGDNGEALDVEVEHKRESVDEESVRKARAQMEPVLHPSHYRGLELMTAFMARVTNPKCTSTVLKVVKNRSEGTAIDHLRGVKAVETEDKKKVLLVLICTLEQGRALAEEIYAQCVAAIRQGPLRDAPAKDYVLPIALEMVQVPRHRPVNRTQAEAWAVHWPISLHTTEDWDDRTKVERMSSAEIANMCLHMRAALGLVEVQLSSGSAGQDLPVAALMVDPLQCHRVTASAVGSSDMCHGKGPLGHPIMVCLDRLSLAHREGQLRPDAYLASGMTLYVTREPCPMCSMALVHSRIARVVYAESNTACGALGSLLTLNADEHLNHNYEVFRGLLSDELDRLRQRMANV